MTAHRRLDHLKHRLKADKKYYDDYKTSMEDIVQLKDVEKVPQEELERETTWYVTQPGMYHWWKREYLLRLQLRQKWNKEKHNIVIGDVVILKDESCTWTLEASEGSGYDSRKGQPCLKGEGSCR